MTTKPQPCLTCHQPTTHRWRVCEDCQNKGEIQSDLMREQDGVQDGVQDFERIYYGG